MPSSRSAEACAPHLVPLRAATMRAERRHAPRAVRDASGLAQPRYGAPSQSFYTARGTSRPPGPADHPALEVWDTSELDAFEDQLKAERERLGEVFRIAKEEKRKVIWKNAQFDLKKVDRIEGWIREIRKDTRRTW